VIAIHEVSHSDQLSSALLITNSLAWREDADASKWPQGRLQESAKTPVARLGSVATPTVCTDRTNGANRRRASRKEADHESNLAGRNGCVGVRRRGSGDADE